MSKEERAANRERWRREVEAWRRSGRKLSHWARERGISRDALAYWKQRIPAGKEPEEQKLRPLTLVPVGPGRSMVSETGAIELMADHLAGWRIRITAGFDSENLGRLLDTLESRC